MTGRYEVKGPENVQEVQAFYRGVEEGIRRYAIYKNGQQFVGALQRPLAQVLAEVEQERDSELHQWLNQ